MELPMERLMDRPREGLTDCPNEGLTDRPTEGLMDRPAKRRPLIIGAALGDCVHVAGVLNFLRLAEEIGYRTAFLGPATSVDRLLGAVREAEPEMVAAGYRLTPDAARGLLLELREGARLQGQAHRRWVFGGTDPVARVAAEIGLFERVFGGSSDALDVITYLRGANWEDADGHDEERRNANHLVGTSASHTSPGSSQVRFPGDLPSRIAWRKPYPVLRHHFGLSSLEATLRGIEEIASSGILDVISIGPDQNTQESFFRPDEMDPLQNGAGGVPLRTPEDFLALWQAAQRGNFPLLRCYSGTRDLIQMAALLQETIRNAWSAVPLFWYNVLDGRSERPLSESIVEAQEVLRWHASRGIPVEVNESHHWSLRDAPDTVAVAAAYLAAYNAKAAGVTHYVSQYMFNNPAGTSGAMDLAKMLAKVQVIESLHDEQFRSYREVRAGLTSFPADPAKAKGHLAASTYLQMALRPDIVHVVAYCEADHAATAPEVIESCLIVRGVIDGCLRGMPDMASDPAVGERKDELLAEARVLLNAIADLADSGVADPLTDPATLTRAVEAGLLDAPHLRGNPVARGRVETRMVGGACRTVGADTGRGLTEKDRIESLRVLSGSQSW